MPAGRAQTAAERLPTPSPMGGPHAKAPVAARRAFFSERLSSIRYGPRIFVGSAATATGGSLLVRSPRRPLRVGNAPESDGRAAGVARIIDRTADYGRRARSVERVAIGRASFIEAASGRDRGPCGRTRRGLCGTLGQKSWAASTTCTALLAFDRLSPL